MYFGYEPLISYMICKYFPPFPRLSFHSLLISLAVKKVSVWCGSHLFIFASAVFAFGVRSKKSLPRLMSRSLCFLLDIMVSGCTFKSLIHFECAFVKDVRQWSDSFFLHEAVCSVSQQHLFLSFFLLDFFDWCGPFLESLLNLLQYCFYFMLWFFGPETRGILVPRPGIEPAPPALEGEVLTTGLPGKSQQYLSQNRSFSFWWRPVYPLVLLWIVILLSYLRNLCLTSQRFSLMFPSGNLIVLGFTFMSMIHFELNFVCGVR